MNNGFTKFSLTTTVLAVFMVFSVFSTSADAFEQLPEISTSVSFDIKERVMKGLSTIILPLGGETEISSGALKIQSMKLNGSSVKPDIKDGKFTVRTGKGGMLEIEYLCMSGQNSPCIIDEKGIFLTNIWYPSVDGLYYHRLKSFVPKEFTAVSEAEVIEVEKRPEGNLFSFSFPHPVEATNFIASAFVVKKETLGGIELYTYFFPEDSGLADTYLEYTRKYITLYEELIGKFPFRRFSVVENFLPTGYSMPSFTLLGQDVVRLPFIVKTSLGHEILHQWFGNLVYIDYDKGNWAEGLTTYLSDHLYEEQEGRGWEYRKQMLVDYESYVSPEKEFALKDFRSRSDSSSKAIGYGKSAMVFHMLKKLVGEGAFYKALRSLVDNNRFRRVSWDDLQVAFEKASANRLDWFFKQWVTEKGVPSLEIKNVAINPKGLLSVVSFDVLQKDQRYVIDLPVSVRADSGETKQTLKIREKKQGFEIAVDGNPEELVIDKDYDTFRRLVSGETPPVIAKVLAEENGLLVFPESAGPYLLFAEAVDFFKGKNYAAKDPNEIKNEEIKKSSVVVLGSGNPILRRLFAMPGQSSPGLSFTVRRNPLNPAKVVAILDAVSDAEIRASLEKITHYGKYSTVVFKAGRNIEKKVAESRRGWSVSLKGAVTGFEVARAPTFEEIIEKVSGKRIIYIGEQHERYEHHVVQLDLIRGLYKRNPRLVIGMEMFIRASQKTIDDYIGGRIDEREFLKSSQYFKQWGFDYNYYKNILRFAKDLKIPVVALNIRREIVSKVSGGGIDSLTEDERKELPAGMDMSDEKYKRRLQEVFEKHDGSLGRDFDNFYQSQVIWDEVMSQTIDDFLKNNPDYQFIVIAGGGHLAFGSGIPERTFRRNGLEYAVVLNEISVEPGVADFVLFPQSAEVTQSPKLLVMLKEENGRVCITAFAEKSVSEKAGLETGDVIVSLDDTKIGSVEDIRIFLFYKKPGDTVKVKVLRKRFLFGEGEREFDVTL